MACSPLIWDEALKISGGDPDYHRRDLWNAIDTGNFPEWELAVQLFDEDVRPQSYDFDVLDATKLIPEEILPLRVIGRMVLDRNPDNYFSETEQVAFCTTHVVPGIDFTNDPLLQGRNFSPTSGHPAQAPGRPELRPDCRSMRPQRSGAQLPARRPYADGHTPKGRVSYSPSSLDETTERPDPAESATSQRAGAMRKATSCARVRSTFADHYQPGAGCSSRARPCRNRTISSRPSSSN